MRLLSDIPNSTHIFDAIIVGTGLAGGWVAKELAEAGASVLLLDAGPLLCASGVRDLGQWTPEVRQEASARQGIQSQHPAYWKGNPSVFVDDIDNPYTSDTDFAWIRGRQLGGRSLSWGGVTLRFSDHEFLAPERDGHGARWPLRYRDLEPHYDHVERALQVQGTQDGLDQLPDGIFGEPPVMSETERRFKSVVEGKWKGRKVICSRGVPLDSSTGSPNNGWAPKTSLRSIIPAALATGRVTVRPNSVVARLIVDPSDGSVKGVTCIDRVELRTFELFGRVTILCASTIESIRIMHNSRDRHHPQGVGNSTGLLGRYLCDHMAVTISGPVPGSAHLPRYPRGGAHGICIPKFRNAGEPSGEFVRGYGISAAMQRGNGRRAAGIRNASWHQTALLEVLPCITNQVEVDEARLDAWGIPTARIHLAYQDNEKRMERDALQNMLAMSHAAHLEVKSIHVSKPGQYVHELGGARMGTDRASSVLNPFNQCWDARNLFVLDGACFVTSGWQNPSLTIMALAVRACRHIARMLRGV